jgi:SAM-dependent methyltransferase
MGLCKITIEELRRHLPAKILSFGYPGRIEEVDMTGSTLTCVDLFRHHGCEEVVDLSLPMPLDFPCDFDVVLDCGTTEHVANPAQSFLNAAGSVKHGGAVIHHLPISCINHGYWNVCPIWFRDFYAVNGFTIHRIELTEEIGTENTQRPWPDNPYYPFPVCLNHLILVVARRDSFSTVRLPQCQPHWIPK